MTVDLGVQAAVERVLRSHRARLLQSGCDQGACVVLENSSVQVLAWAGSLGWGAETLGYNDGVLARRSAGSTLKPFVYALALERGLTLAAVVTDERRSFDTPLGEYDPRNFDRREYGAVRLRTALASSLNGAAVDVARRVGTEAIGGLLDGLHLLSPSTCSGDLGVGVAIGNAEVTLMGLAGAYCAIANGGKYRKPVAVAGEARPAASRVMPAAVAFLIADALADPAARLLTFGFKRCFQFPFPVALKTGTSTDYRDCWAVRFAPRHTAAVWVGNFSGRPTWKLAGATGAGPILHDVLMELHPGGPGEPFARPPGILEAEICTSSGRLASAGCGRRALELFLTGAARPDVCDGRCVRAGEPGASGPSAAWKVEIAYPHRGDRFAIPRTAGPTPEITISARVRGHASTVRWYLDGREAAVTEAPFRWRWTLERGRHVLLAATSDLGAAARTEFVVE